MNELVKRLRDIAERNGAVMNTSLYSEAADLIEQQTGEIAKLKQVAAEMADGLEHFGGDPIADEPLGKWKELGK